MDPNAIYRGMDRAALDVAYNNVAAVADFATMLADFRQRSAALYGQHDWRRNLEYGNTERERFDLVRSLKADAPTVIYVHGGYWQSLSKEEGGLRLCRRRAAGAWLQCGSGRIHPGSAGLDDHDGRPDRPVARPRRL